MNLTQNHPICERINVEAINSETELTASILKKDPKTQEITRTLFD